MTQARKLDEHQLLTLAELIEKQLPNGTGFVLSVFKINHPASESVAVANVDGPSAAAGLRATADKFEANPTMAAGPSAMRH